MLLHTDFKTFTKILTQRICHSLGDLVQKYQYARPGGQASTTTTLLRDLHWEAKYNDWEGYFISLDFQKAFDSVDRNWSYKVLNAMQFPPLFIKEIVELNTNTFSSIIVNGFITRFLLLARGVRQGDPLSLFLFFVAVGPLVSYINDSPAMQEIEIGKNQIKCSSYADDMTLTLIGKYSVQKAVECVQIFEKASGLCLNEDKTQGLTTQTKLHAELPHINWNNRNLNILVTIIGNENQKEKWEKSLSDLKQVIRSLNRPYLTWEAKCLLVKAKVMPIINYTASTYPISNQINEKIVSRILAFMGGPHISTPSLEILQMPKDLGGYNITNIKIHGDLTYLKNVSKYVKIRTQHLELDTQATFIEHQIGHTLSNLFNLNQLNHLSHKIITFPYYRHTLDLIKKYSTTKKELECGKIKNIYTRIINDISVSTRAVTNKSRWKTVHNPIFPDYLKTFNYKLVHNILSFQTKFCNFSLDKPKSFCVFCNKGPDSAFQVFKSCKKLIMIWQFLDSLIRKTTSIAVPIVQDQLSLNDSIPASLTQSEADTIILLITITNHKIWKAKNTKIYQNTKINARSIIEGSIAVSTYKSEYKNSQMTLVVD